MCTITDKTHADFPLHVAKMQGTKKRKVRYEANQNIAIVSSIHAATLLPGAVACAAAAENGCLSVVRVAV
jgi:hypothetical protein